MKVLRQFKKEEWQEAEWSQLAAEALIEIVKYVGIFWVTAYVVAQTLSEVFIKYTPDLCKMMMK